VHVTFSAIGPDLIIEVQDDGPGISEEKLRVLFDGGPHAARMGLGLTLVRDVMAAHGGSLEVHSDTKTFRPGTTVRLTLSVS
jgi:signal transduction histidine kinase